MNSLSQVFIFQGCTKVWFYELHYRQNNSQQYVVLYTEMSIHWYFKFCVFTFWNLSPKIKCRVALTKVFLTQIFLLLGQFCVYSRQVCNKRLTNWTANADTLTLNGFTRNSKPGFNSWKWSNLAWNSSSSITNYFSILPLCGLPLPLRETHGFSFRRWENDRMLLTMCLWKILIFFWEEN